MSVGARVTVEEYLAGDWPPNSQLIDGEVVVNDPALPHQRAVGAIFGHLWTWCRAGPGRGEAGLGCNWVPGVGANVYKPDAWWMRPERLPAESVTWLDGAPDLVVEVRSPGTWRYDVGVRRDVYEAAGVTELWLVDPGAATFTLLRRPAPGAPAFAPAEARGLGEPMTTPLLVGFEVPVEDLLGRP